MRCIPPPHISQLNTLDYHNSIYIKYACFVLVDTHHGQYGPHERWAGAEAHDGHAGHGHEHGKVKLNNDRLKAIGGYDIWQAMYDNYCNRVQSIFILPSLKHKRIEREVNCYFFAAYVLPCQCNGNDPLQRLDDP